MERMAGWVAGLALGSAASLSCAPAAPPASVVLITIDTLRADHLGCYGYFRHTSPFIDQLAADGLLFERAITPMSTTLPAHTSLMTSAYPARHGVLSNLNFYHQPVVTDKGFQTAAQMFREAGYLTAGFVSSPGLGEESGITAGFQVFDESGIRDAFTTTSRVIDWLDSVPARPFFLWVHYFDPHHPYDPPPTTGTTGPTSCSCSSLRRPGSPRSIASSPCNTAISMTERSATPTTTSGGCSPGSASSTSTGHR